MLTLGAEAAALEEGKLVAVENAAVIQSALRVVAKEESHGG